MTVRAVNYFSSHVQLCERKLDDWVADSPPGERAARIEAAKLISEVRENHTMILSLSGLQLTTCPPLPEWIEVLNLNENQFSGILDFSGLKNLTMLYLSRCGLNIFPYFASDTNLVKLDLSGNPLQVFPADDRLPRVTFYDGTRPASEEAERRLGRGIGSVVQKPEGKLVSPFKFFQTTSPPIGILKYGHALIMGPKLPKLIENMGAIPVIVDLEEPSIDVEAIRHQVQQAIPVLRKLGERSIPIALLRNVDPNSPIGKIQQFAKEQMKRVQGVVLPGGPNVEQEFYNPQARMLRAPNYIQSISEFAFIQEATKVGKPVAGSCRGEQILNVYYGGKLGPGQQNGWHSVEVVESSCKEEVEKLIEGKSMPAFSSHDECCKEIASNLEVVLKSGNIPSLLVSKDPKISVFGWQIHIEETYRNQYSIGYRLLEPFVRKVLKQPRISKPLSPLGLSSKLFRLAKF